jgi:uncharacterized protein with GYD domain
MPVFITLITLNEGGRESIKSNPKKIKANKTALEAMGVKVLGQYITLGQYDFVNVFEARDEKHILQAAVNLTGRGIDHTETLVALSVEDYLKTIKKKA